MKYSLRSLMIVATVAPPVLVGGFYLARWALYELIMSYTSGGWCDP